MHEKKLEYLVIAGLTLKLENLFAEVEVRAGAEGATVVQLAGDQRSLDDIEVVWHDSKNISIRSKGGGGVNIIGTSIVVNGGVVMVNGKIIPGCEPREMTRIAVDVPQGTSLEISDVKVAAVSGVNGTIRARVSGQSEFRATDVVNAKVKCSGQSHCQIGRATGTAKFSASGQSEIEASGEFGDVEAEASGMSRVKLNGNCGNVEAEASGMSKVIVRGRVSGSVREHKSGMSEINIREA